MEMLRQHPSATIELESLLSLGDNRANRDRIIETLVHNFALDPKFVAIAVRMVQYYANYSDRALGFEDGTTAGRIETTLELLKEVHSLAPTGNIFIQGDRKGNLESIIGSTYDHVRSFCVETAAKPSTWNVTKTSKVFEYCKEALRLARVTQAQLQGMENEEKIVGSRNDKRDSDGHQEGKHVEQGGSKRKREEPPSGKNCRRRS